MVARQRPRGNTGQVAPARAEGRAAGLGGGPAPARERVGTQWSASEGGMQRKRSVYSGFEKVDGAKTSEA